MYLRSKFGTGGWLLVNKYVPAQALNDFEFRVAYIEYTANSGR